MINRKSNIGVTSSASAPAINTKNYRHETGLILTYLTDLQLSLAHIFAGLDVHKILSKYSRFSFRYERHNLIRKILLSLVTVETLRTIVLTWWAYHQNEYQQPHWLFDLIFRDCLATTRQKKRILYHLTLLAIGTIFIMRWLFYRRVYSCRLATFLLSKAPSIVYYEDDENFEDKFSGQRLRLCTDHHTTDNFYNVDSVSYNSPSQCSYDATSPRPSCHNDGNRIEETHLLLSPNFRKSHPLRDKYRLNRHLLDRCYNPTCFRSTNVNLEPPLHYNNEYWRRMVVSHSLLFPFATVCLIIQSAFTISVYFINTFDDRPCELVDTLKNDSHHRNINLNIEQFHKDSGHVSPPTWLDIFGFVECCLIVLDFYVTYAYSYTELILIYIDLAVWQRTIHARLDEIIFIQYWRNYLFDKRNRLCLTKDDLDKAIFHIINDLHNYFLHVGDCDKLANVCNLTCILTVSFNLVYTFFNRYVTVDSLYVLMSLHMANTIYFGSTMCLFVVHINSKVRIRL